MVTSAANLVSVPELGLKALWEGDHYDDDISWIHPTDLFDPTPFLKASNLIITTGSQLMDKTGPDFDEYVKRLKHSGIYGIAFGSDVHFEGTPELLVDACQKYNLTLIDIPYVIPGMALTRWVSETQTAQARMRDSWVIETMQALSLAALRKEGISSVLRELTNRLPIGVFLIDSNGEAPYAFPATGDFRDLHDRVVQEARELLGKNQRAGKEMSLNNFSLHLQTLGKQQNLYGVLAIVSSEKLNREELSVVTGVVALAELSLEQSTRLQQATGLLRSEIIGFLCEGHVQAATKVSGLIGSRLPDDPIIVSLLKSSEHSAAIVESLIMRMKIFAQESYFSARIEDQVVLVLPVRSLSILQKFVKHYGLLGGTSAIGSYNYFQKHLDQARYALNHSSSRGDLVEYLPEMEDTIVTMLGKPVIERLAQNKFEPLAGLSDRDELLRSLETWLKHNGAWDGASRELGIHRHSLRNRISKLEGLLGLDLDDFETKTYLWALLRFQK
ncbi:MAG: helix-turn-helix domain-containing protein [Microbacteriaceae bacterium]